MPVLFGFRSPATEWLAVPAWAAVVVVVACVISYARGRSVFHVFAILTPCVFLISGAYIDAQSYRYLMPLHAALPVVYATGIDTALRANRWRAPRCWRPSCRCSCGNKWTGTGGCNPIAKRMRSSTA